jgi:hypothetical protein
MASVRLFGIGAPGLQFLKCIPWTRKANKLLNSPVTYARTVCHVALLSHEWKFRTWENKLELLPIAI